LSIYQNNNVSVKIDAVSEVIKVCGCLIATSYLLGGLKWSEFEFCFGMW